MTKTFSNGFKYLCGVSWDAKFHEITLNLEFSIHFTPVTSCQSQAPIDTSNTVVAWYFFNNNGNKDYFLKRS